MLYSPDYSYLFPVVLFVAVLVRIALAALVVLPILLLVFPVPVVPSPLFFLLLPLFLSRTRVVERRRAVEETLIK